MIYYLFNEGSSLFIKKKEAQSVQYHINVNRE